jgi:hypothetical protein
MTSPDRHMPKWRQLVNRLEGVIKNALTKAAFSRQRELLLLPLLTLGVSVPLLREYSVLRKFLVFLGLRGGMHAELKQKTQKYMFYELFINSGSGRKLELLNLKELLLSKFFCDTTNYPHHGCD